MDFVHYYISTHYRLYAAELFNDLVIEQISHTYIRKKCKLTIYIKSLTDYF